MLCLCGDLLNPYVAPVALPEPHRQCPSRAAGSFTAPSADDISTAPSIPDANLLLHLRPDRFTAAEHDHLCRNWRSGRSQSAGMVASILRLGRCVSQYCLLWIEAADRHTHRSAR